MLAIGLVSWFQLLLRFSTGEKSSSETPYSFQMVEFSTSFHTIRETLSIVDPTSSSHPRILPTLSCYSGLIHGFATTNMGLVPLSLFEKMGLTHLALGLNIDFSHFWTAHMEDNQPALVVQRSMPA
jgi:hypothetical protein